MAGLSKFPRNITTKNAAILALGLSAAWAISRKLNEKRNKRLVNLISRNEL